MTVTAPAETWYGTGPSAPRGRPRHWPVGLLLALALLMRLPQMLAPFPNLREDIEVGSLAFNLAHGHGFFLDLKTHWGIPAPVVHYGGYEHAMLTPALLALLQGFMPDAWALRIFNPLLFLATLGLLHQTLRREFGPGVAGGAVLLLAVHPLLLEPGTGALETHVRLFCFVLVLNALLCRRSAILTGMACSLGFLAHPSFLLITACLLAGHAWGALRHGQTRAFGLFVPFALIGPLWWSSFNLAMGAPVWTFPGMHLYQSLNPEGGNRLFNAWEHRQSAGELLKTEPRALLAAFRQHLAECGRMLGSPRGVLPLLICLPLALAGAAGHRALRRWGWMPLLAGAELLWWLGSWPVPAAPVQLMPMTTALIVLVMIATYEILDREPALRRRHGWISGAALLSAGLGLFWFATALPVLANAAAAIRTRTGGALHVYLGKPLAAAGPDAVAASLLARARLNDARGDTDFIVASNEPWLIHARTALPALLLPWDLESPQWAALCETSRADALVIFESCWPEAWRDRLDDLARDMQKAGWRPAPVADGIRLWFAPLLPAPAVPARGSV